MSDQMLESQAVATAPPQNMGKAWSVMIALFVSGVSVAFGVSKLMPVVSVMMVDLQVSAQVAGWINSVFSFMGIVLAFPAAGMIRKLGIRLSGLLSVIVPLCGAIIGWLAPDQMTLLLGRVLEGFGVGIIGVMAPAMIAMWFPAEKRGLPMGIWSAWMIVPPAFCFLFANTIVGPDVVWRNMYLVGIIFLAVGLVAFMAFVRPPKGDEPNYADSSDSSVPLTGAFKSSSVWLMSIGGMGFGIAIGVFCAWVPTYWDMMGAMPLMTGNFAIGVIYFGEIIACFCSGLLLNKIKHRQRFFIVIGITYAVGLFFAYHSGASFTGAVLVCIVYFICEGCFVATMWTLLPNTVKDPRLAAGAMAIFNMFNNFGMMIGIPIAGAILDATMFTGWGYLAILAGACQLIAGILGFKMKIYNNDGEVIPL